MYTRFQTKKAQNPSPLGRHILIWLIYKGVPFPPPPPTTCNFFHNLDCLNLLIFRHYTFNDESANRARATQKYGTPWLVHPFLQIYITTVSHFSGLRNAVVPSVRVQRRWWLLKLLLILMASLYVWGKSVHQE